MKLGSGIVLLPLETYISFQPQELCTETSPKVNVVELPDYAADPTEHHILWRLS